MYALDKDDPRKSVHLRATADGKLLVDGAGGGGSSSPGTDSDGNALPAGFDTLAETYTYENGQVKTIAKTSGSDTYTQTFTYTDGQLTGVSQWVKS